MAERPDENRPTTPPPPPQRAGYVAAPGKPAAPPKDQPDHATPAGQGSRQAEAPQPDRKTPSEAPSKAPASSAASPAPQAAASGKARRKAARQTSRGSRLARLFFAVAVIGVVGFFGLMAVGATGYALIAREIPDPSQLQQRQSTFASTKIYDRNGDLLVELTDPTDPTAGRRTYVRLDQINPSLIQATLATEDPNFYRYSVGFDPIALVRIVYYAITERDFVSGGSTITQQVARNLLLDPAERQSRSLMRKIREIILANELARRYSRDTILEIYLNEINYGNLAYGIEAASQTYFGKPAKELNLAEASLLAGLPQAPSYWDPVAHKDRALRRQRDVLRLMTQAGYITGNQAAAASAEIEAKAFEVRPPNISNVAPHFMNYVRQLLDDEFGSDGLYRVGLRVYTTLDPRVQSIAEQTVKEQVAKLADKHVTNGAVVAMDPRNGEVLAMVGSADFDNEQIDGQVNVALAPRQPGSSIKPFTYLAAFEKGYTPATLFWDAPISYTNQYGQVYTPRNYDGKFHGPMLLREALARSMNIPAVETMAFVGVPGFLELTERAGIHFPPNDQYGLALTLGGGEARLLDLTTGYATLANDGAQVKPTAIRRVELADGQVVHDYLQSPERSQVIAPEHAYLITRHPERQRRARPEFRPQQRAEALAAGGGENRHDQRFPRQPDGRLHAGTGRRGVGGQQRQLADERRVRHHRRGADLARRDGEDAGRPAAHAVRAPTRRRGG